MLVSGNNRHAQKATIDPLEASAHVNPMTVIHSPRGIVIGSPIVKSHGLMDAAALMGQPTGRKRFMRTDHRHMLDSTIRRSIFLFDEIEVPDNDFQPIALPEIDLLVQQGVITRRVAQLDEATVPVSLGAQQLLLSQANTYVFQHLDRTEPGKWSFAPLGAEVDWYPPTKIPTTTAVEIDLRGIIPVPDAGVEYADILDFKARRQPELLRMRDLLGRLYSEAVSTGGIPYSKPPALAELEVAIDDLRASLKESPVRSVLKSILVQVIVEPALAASGAAEIAKENLGLSEHFQIAAAAAGAVYKWSSVTIDSPVLRAGPLAYLYHAVREGIAKT